MRSRPRPRPSCAVCPLLGIAVRRALLSLSAAAVGLRRLSLGPLLGDRHPLYRARAVRANQRLRANRSKTYGPRSRCRRTLGLGTLCGD